VSGIRTAVLFAMREPRRFPARLRVVCQEESLVLGLYRWGQVIASLRIATLGQTDRRNSKKRQCIPSVLRMEQIYIFTTVIGIVYERRIDHVYDSKNILNL
jgi:hypothetical protein